MGGGIRRGRREPYGYDPVNKINGRKRHLLVDTMGLLIAAVVHRSDAGVATARRCSSLPCVAPSLGPTNRCRCRICRPPLQQALANWAFEIIHRSLPRRWVVGRAPSPG